MDGLTQSALLHARAVRRVWRDRPPRPARLLAGLDDRLVFVFGCPRSGTTFLAGALGRLGGFVDLGEVAPLKAAIPTLAAQDPEQAARCVRRILSRVQRLAVTGGLRAIEQTPETVFVAQALPRAYPAATRIHLVRDGRDVACSLRDRGWLSAARGGRDDAGHAYGSSTRFWVEPERAGEFAEVSDARRTAWAWRRYVEAGLALGQDAVEVRYEELTARPGEVAARLAAALGHPADELQSVLSAAHDESVGRHRTELTADELADIELEAGSLLRKLGYA